MRRLLILEQDFAVVLLKRMVLRGELLAPVLRLSQLRSEAFSRFWIKFSGKIFIYLFTTSFLYISSAASYVYILTDFRRKFGASRTSWLQCSHTAAPRQSQRCRARHRARIGHANAALHQPGPARDVRRRTMRGAPHRTAGQNRLLRPVVQISHSTLRCRATLAGPRPPGSELLGCGYPEGYL